MNEKTPKEAVVKGGSKKSKRSSKVVNKKDSSHEGEHSSKDDTRRKRRSKETKRKSSRKSEIVHNGDNEETSSAQDHHLDQLNLSEASFEIDMSELEKSKEERIGNRPRRRESSNANFVSKLKGFRSSQSSSSLGHEHKDPSDSSVHSARSSHSTGSHLSSASRASARRRRRGKESARSGDVSNQQLGSGSGHSLKKRKRLRFNDIPEIIAEFDLVPADKVGDYWHPKSLFQKNQKEVESEVMLEQVRLLVVHKLMSEKLPDDEIKARLAAIMEQPPGTILEFLESKQPSKPVKQQKEESIPGTPRQSAKEQKKLNAKKDRNLLHSDSLSTEQTKTDNFKAAVFSGMAINQLSASKQSEFNDEMTFLSTMDGESEGGMSSRRSMRMVDMYNVSDGEIEQEIKCSVCQSMFVPKAKSNSKEWMRAYVCPSCEDRILNIDGDWPPPSLLSEERQSDEVSSPSEEVIFLLTGQAFTLYGKQDGIGYRSIHLELEKGSTPYIDISKIRKDNPEEWTLPDGTLAGPYLRFSDGWKLVRHALLGSVKFEYTNRVKGSYQWDCLLNFSTDFDRIESGIIVHRQELLRSAAHLPSRYSFREKQLSRYPFDGTWTVFWDDKEEIIEVECNHYVSAGWTFYLTFESPQKVSIRWPRSTTKQYCDSIDLMKTPMGPEVGDTIAWKTTSDQFTSEIIWYRVSRGNFPVLPNVTLFGQCGKELLDYQIVE